MKVAVIGASGFIGTQMVERWKLNNSIEVVPIVRAYSSLAVLSRFDLPWQVCNILDPHALFKAMKGCDAVVHTAIGDSRQIVQMADSIYRGALAAKVRRLVILSSASVHGQTPSELTDETSTLHARHRIAYNNAKVRAEKRLWRLCATGDVEVVALRPSVVYGPRSKWIAEIGQQVIEGTAGLIDGGKGFCNGIYVDNLIQAVELSLVVPGAAGEVFLVRDDETITWRVFYEKIANELGLDGRSLNAIEKPVFRRSFRQRIVEIALSPSVCEMLRFVPSRVKRLSRLVLQHWDGPASERPAIGRECPPCVMTEEMALLQQCKWRLPIEKAKRILSYNPEVSFEEGIRRSIAWLKFTGLFTDAKRSIGSLL